MFLFLYTCLSFSISSVETAPSPQSNETAEIEYERKYLKCLYCNDVDTLDACTEEKECAPGQVYNSQPRPPHPLIIIFSVCNVFGWWYLMVSNNFNIIH